MEIRVNAASAALGGGVTVLRCLLPAFIEADGGRHHYTVVGRAEVQSQIDPHHQRVDYVATWVGNHSLAARVVSEQLTLPVRAALRGADVLFSPANLAVWGSPVPQLLMFQNLSPFTPHAVQSRSTRGKARLLALRSLGVVSAKLADRVVFISHAQREVILPWLGIAAERSSTVHLGRDSAFSPAAKAQAPALLRELGLPERYLLCVSQFYRHKNLVELVRGFALAVPSLPDDVQLVLAGAPHDPWYFGEVQRVIKEKGLEQRVRLLGHLPYEHLPPLYAGAALLLFPSSCESFPNVLIEGLSSGVPVLSSSLCSMPELAQDGALYFDAFSPPDIADKIVRIWRDPTEQARLRRAGVHASARFSWRETASELLQLLEATVH